MPRASVRVSDMSTRDMYLSALYNDRTIWTRFFKNFLDSASIGTELFKILPTAQSLLVLDGGYAEMANLILAYIILVIDSGKNLKISPHSRLCLLLLHKFKNYCFTICNFNNCILSKKKLR